MDRPGFEPGTSALPDLGVAAFRCARAALFQAELPAHVSWYYYALVLVINFFSAPLLGYLA